MDGWIVDCVGRKIYKKREIQTGTLKDIDINNRLDSQPVDLYRFVQSNRKIQVFLACARCNMRTISFCTICTWTFFYFRLQESKHRL